MSIERFPVGMEIEVTYAQFRANLTLLSTQQLKFEIKEGPFAHAEVVDIEVVPLGNSIFAVSWQENDGSTVTNIQDYDRCVVYSNATLPNGKFLRMNGSFEIIRSANQEFDDRPQRNKEIVLEAMTSLFQKRDASTVERLYAADYIQHNPHIPQGRDALKTLVSQMSEDVFYEPGLMIAEGDLVAIHGRIRGWANVPQVVVDIFRVEDGKLAEHWDVLQNEERASSTLGAVSMFDANEGLQQKLKN
ncbi:nuclear transport factor 2 family protein [Massilia sp. KIM]|uniref:nuclear transport factor 2 family protein n=1 Tax=Massilia sp. KIM TaxID=1955422 RepID=UPI001C4DF933|nr:nuclear transport factor 2 family protein [Massilia sp. KIM]